MIVTVNCISLADQHDRRAYMRSQLDICGLPYHFVDAMRIDLADGWPATYQRQRRLNYAGIDLRPGEMGCALSHRQVWRNFLAGDEEICLVLEDDVEIHPDFADVVKSLVEAAQEWEFVRLFGMYKSKAFPVCHLVGDHYLVDYLKQPNGTQGYLLNRQAAQRLLRYTEAMWHAIDNLIDCDWEHGVRVMGVVPSAISELKIFDTTLGTVEKRKLTLVKKMSREYHRIGHNFKKQVWILKKRLQLRLRGRDSSPPVK